MLNVVYLSNCFNKDSLSIFTENFNLASTTYSYNIDQQEMVSIPSYNSVRFGRKSIIHSVTLTWNHLQDKLTEYDFLHLSPKSLKILLLKFSISAYDNYWQTF